MNTADQMTDEIYGLHCDIGRLENEKKHWHTEFINEHEYAHMLEEQAEKTEAENAKLRELVRDMYGFIKRMDEECGDVTFSDCFDYCKHDTTGDGCCKTGECWYERSMRELGVEV